MGDVWVEQPETSSHFLLRDDLVHGKVVKQGMGYTSHLVSKNDTENTLRHATLEGAKLRVTSG